MGTGAIKAKAKKKATPRKPRIKKAEKLSLVDTPPAPIEQAVNEVNTEPMETKSGLISKSEFEALPDVEKLKILEAKIDQLNERQSWQEHIHRNVLENGNVTHYYNIVPSIFIAAAVGAAGALAIIFVVDNLKNRK